MKKPIPAHTPASNGSAIASHLASLSDATRLRILGILEQSELAVGELARALQLPQSTASRHLKILTQEGWLGVRGKGTTTFYRLLMDDLTPELRTLWAAVRTPAAQQKGAQEDRKRLRAVLAQRRTDSQSFFGRVGESWDDVRQQLFGDLFAGHALLSLLPRHWTVADLGCGTGNAAQMLAPCVQTVIAVDQSRAMLSAASQRLKGLKNIRFARGTLEKPPLKPGSVDAAVCVLVLHHLPDPALALARLRRCLRSDRGGGVLLVVDMVPHERDEYRQTMGHQHLGFSRTQIEDLFTQAGFGRSITYHELECDPDAKGPGLFVATGRI